MNKVEFYNACIELRKKTGQGMAGFVRMKLGSQMIDELIEEGLLKSIKKSYSYLPNDEFLCLTKGYCVEDDYDSKEYNALACVRLYLGQEDLGLGAKPKDALSNVDFMEGYAKWLKKNKSALEEMDNFKELEEDANLNNFKTDEMDYLKSRGWFKKNLSIKECLDKLEEGTRADEKKVDILKELISLMGNHSVVDKYKDDLDKNKKDLEKTKSEIKIRNKINRWLSETKDKSIKVQDLVSELQG